MIDDYINKIILGDCLPVLKALPDASVDLVVTDPPYYKCSAEKWDNAWPDFGSFMVWCDTWMAEVKRVLKPNGSVYIFTAFGDNFDDLTAHIYSWGFKVRNMVLWWRETPGFKQSERRYTINYELIWFLTKSDDYIFNTDKIRVQHWRKFDKRANPLGKNPGCIWYEFNIKMGRHKESEGNDHPTPKPIKLIQRMILASSNPGDIVLDPFMGSGTTAVVCKRLARKFIGTEISPEYHKLAMSRLNNIPQSLDLFG